MVGPHTVGSSCHAGESQFMNNRAAQWLTVGRISGVHGVRGWLKVQSYTAPPEQILRYQPWTLDRAGVKKQVEPVDSKLNGKAVIISLAGITDRDQAMAYVNSDIVVSPEQLPVLPAGQYYWFQLQGLRVVSVFENNSTDLGKVVRILETGANDVLVVQGDERSLDRKERLVPYLLGSTVVDLDQNRIQVDWDPEF